MNTVVALPIVAAVPTIAPAMHAVDPQPDPIFVALDAFRLAEAEFYAERSGDIPDEIGARWSEAMDVVIRTQPTTPAGLGALTGFARDMAERSTRDAGLPDGGWVLVMTAIDDATRGMSGLEPWSPPLRAEKSVTFEQHPDAELFAAIDRYHAAVREFEIRQKAWSPIELINPRPRGYASKERAYLQAMKHYGKVEAELADVRARTLDGLIAKARTVGTNRTEFAVSELLPDSIVDDLRGMQSSREVVPLTPKLSAGDEKLIALGKQFEPLLDEYYVAHKIWSHGDGKDPGTNWAKLSALSKAVRKLPASSMAGLRVHALVAFWEVSPLCKGDTEYSFCDEYPFQVLFAAVAEYCGLNDKIALTGYSLPDEA